MKILSLADSLIQATKANWVQYPNFAAVKIGTALTNNFFVTATMDSKDDLQFVFLSVSGDNPNLVGTRLDGHKIVNGPRADEAVNKLLDGWRVIDHLPRLLGS